MTSHPRIAVVVPTHNSAQSISRALNSVLVQTRPADDIIVVDDCSTDSTCEIVGGYSGSGVRLLRLAAQRGAAEARNSGVAATDADLVAFLDSDDEWLGRKLEKQESLITSDPAISFVASEVTFLAPDGSDLGDLFRCSCVVTGPDAWKALLACNFIATSSMMTWRRRFQDVGGFDPGLKIGEDQDLFIKLALAGSFDQVAEKLVLQHERVTSLSTWDLDDLLTYTLPMIEKHLADLETRLSRAEIRRIRGERLSRFGRVAYARGRVSVGVLLLGRSVLNGYRPLENLYVLAAASPLAIAVKKLLLGA